MLISTDIWVAALIRRAEAGGAAAAVVKKGDTRAGVVLLKTFNTLERQARLYSRSIGQEGEPIWIEPLPEHNETELDAYAKRQIDFDPDLWLIEIEDRQGRHFLQEPVKI